MPNRLAILPALLLLLALPAAAGERIPDITGTWAAKSELHHALKGFAFNKLVVVIEEQQGRAFRGRKEYIHVNGGADVVEPFSGVVSRDGKRVFVAEHGDAGIMDGEIVSSRKMIWYYRETGPDAMAAYLLLVRER